ncbi:uncharacterized protein [Coffea arabica]|uniref:Uncharacterized protein n=1 Tax=Coffea arabica TaxID=13443 RepID=A0ABM4WCU3_COFAR
MSCGRGEHVGRTAKEATAKMWGSRRKRNRISRLEKDQGGWCTTDDEIGVKITQFYDQLFTFSQRSDFEEILNGIPRTITEQMNLQLTRPVTEKEVKIVVFSMHPNKSPSLDAINETLVTLIPKIDNPLNLAHFRPIRQILDNVMVAHEYMHWLKSKREGRDRWIHGYLSSVSYSFNVNGVKRGYLIVMKQDTKKTSYGKASGQQVNINKSAVFFSKNSSEREKTEVLQKLGEIQQVSQGKYLGIPLVVGRSKNSVFRFIKENMMSRIQNWKGKLLSNTRKDVLLKSVALALPSYAMSIFRLSKSLCKELRG